jgi:hypothetical protein
LGGWVLALLIGPGLATSVPLDKVHGWLCVRFKLLNWAIFLFITFKSQFLKI